MKILILEDSAERIREFKKNLIGHDLYFFDNVREAKDAFSLIGGFEFIFIDHDLDNKVFVDSFEENTGYQFAKFLSTQDLSGVQNIVIHSMNTVGADNISYVLPEAQKIPFVNLFK